MVNQSNLSPGSPMKSSTKPSRQLAEEGQLRHPGLERLAPSSAGTGRYPKAHQKRKHTAYSKPSGRLLRKTTRKPTKYPQLFRQNKLLTKHPPQDSPQKKTLNGASYLSFNPCWTKRPDELRICALVWLYRLEQPKENKFSGLRSFPKGPLVPLLARAAFLLGSHSQGKDRVGLEVACILLDNILLAWRKLQG